MSREEAIKDIEENILPIVGGKSLRMAIDALRQPQRKKGRWIPLQLSMANPPYQCSCCFQNAPMIETGCLMNRHLEALLTDFCPNCGADMREDAEEPKKCDTCLHEREPWSMQCHRCENFNLWEAKQ